MGAGWVGGDDQGLEESDLLRTNTAVLTQRHGCEQELQPGPGSRLSSYWRCSWEGAVAPCPSQRPPWTGSFVVPLGDDTLRCRLYDRAGLEFVSTMQVWDLRLGVMVW